MARHAICDKTGKVVNVIIWDGAEFLPPRDHYVIQDDSVNVGDTYDFKSKKFFRLNRVAIDHA